MQIYLSVECVNCGEDIKRDIISDDNEVPLFLFKQTEWKCQKCGHITVIGDINIEDKEDLLKWSEESNYDQ